MGVSEVTVPLATPGGSAGFASHHKADAIFFPCLLAFIWAGLLFGFVPEIHRHIVQHKPPYLWIVHLHAVVFVGWMVLLNSAWSAAATSRCTSASDQSRFIGDQSWSLWGSSLRSWSTGRGSALRIGTRSFFRWSWVT
jgi:hypothetical protein